MMMLTPQKAADHAKVARQSIMSAIKAGKLKATRNNRSWLIDPEDLEQWMQSRMQPSAHTAMHDADRMHAVELAGLRIEIAELRGQISGKNELIDQLRRDLEHARMPFWKRWF